MKRRLEALVDELKRLKNEGVTHLSVTDGSLQALRTAVEQSHGGRLPERLPPADSAGRVDLPVNHVRQSEAPQIFARIMATAKPRPEDGQEAPSASGKPKPAPAPKLPAPPIVELADGDKKMRWNALREQVLQCPECNAHVHGKTRIVFGVGDIDADIFFCGEAPGAEEELQGEPFVGPAGQVLDKIIRAMGLNREAVYIGNIMNWRPEVPRNYGNRPPTAEELSFCLPYLKAQIEIVDPKVVVALGGTAAKGLLGLENIGSLGQVRGRWRAYDGRSLMITYHPSYLLRTGSNRTKRLVWEDLLQVMERVGLPISEKQRQFFL